VKNENGVLMQAFAMILERIGGVDDEKEKF